MNSLLIILRLLITLCSLQVFQNLGIFLKLYKIPRLNRLTEKCLYRTSLQVNIANAFDSQFSGFSDGLTGLDVWLRFCMLFVALAIGEYATVLFLRFSRRKKRSFTNEEKREIVAFCEKIDRFSALFYVGSFAFYNFIYWISYLN